MTKRFVSRQEIISIRQALTRQGLKPATSQAARPIKDCRPKWEKQGQSWIELKRGVEFTPIYETPVGIKRTNYWR